MAFDDELFELKINLDRLVHVGEKEIVEVVRRCYGPCDPRGWRVHAQGIYRLVWEISEPQRWSDRLSVYIEERLRVERGAVEAFQLELNVSNSIHEVQAEMKYLLDMGLGFHVHGYRNIVKLGNGGQEAGPLLRGRRYGIENGCNVHQGILCVTNRKRAER